ncbi:NAD(P)/FAD-dependent oxidoreductase [[Flexibacter] sp. ATCC 35208]|uniref:NAD(P)/FAD-dependent oxidoreductase n=1 Tax=[Flexibacter] sp. ATCC 35208 TaxID=1936242 RepID=UPI0009D62CB6|nr:NAD(P)/FAD-dependent oxidoreductase [[Flexibacter] sp. ATCC 35208]OMP80062.1 hypothetical protein BW716_06095 [[Flexibacter] sp. ATCC 35208]
MNKTAIIIGAGPAGLTAAYELLTRTDIKPVILEKSHDIGGISRTIRYKGNRMDIGGHRFFSKSDRVMKWWLQFMPLDIDSDPATRIHYQGKSRTISKSLQAELESTEKKSATPPTPNTEPFVMLLRRRLSRIFFLRKFFNYPLQLSFDTLQKLGFGTTMRIFFSYVYARVFPRKHEKSLEDFFINRFGQTLYQLFFKDYTEKVWGVSCREISPEWGAQRIKGLSITKALEHAIKSVTRKHSKDQVSQKDTETSLIENFLYPALGPGQLWEEVARQIQVMGGEIHFGQNVAGIATTVNVGGNSIDQMVKAVKTKDSETGESYTFCGDYFFSTMPVQELIAGMGEEVPGSVREVAAGLQYRDFITVGLLIKKTGFGTSNTTHPLETLQDTWIYIQEKDMKVGRIQLFHNWSPYLVKDSDTCWVGMEYFCQQGDELWQLTDEQMKQVATCELESMGLISPGAVIDGTVARIEKTYPAYFGTYDQFNSIKEYVDQHQNLFLVGRNGMHKYNNADHSMLTAMTAVDNIIDGIVTKANIWAINTEQEYHEEKATAGQQTAQPAPDSTQIERPYWKEWLQQPRYKTYGWLAIAAVLIQWIVFKYLYPYASFINGDSYAYLETAYHNLTINTYPVGYSMFLRLVSVFTKSDTALVTVQYLIQQASLVGWLFSVFYFLRLGRAVEIILLCFWVCNPVFLYLANYVSSDSLFLTLSLVWFTILLWILFQPTKQLLFWHGIVIILAFMVRYNAMWYPIISVCVISLSQQSLIRKAAGIMWSLALIGLFGFYTAAEYQRTTGIRQFSPFSGWQLANNALYAYRYVDGTAVKKVPPRFQELDKTVRTYFDTTRDTDKYPQELLKASTVYMWDIRSPLQIYMLKQFRKDPLASSLKRWAKVGPLYKEYGSYLIRQYPVTFIQMYVWPNFLKYYAPPVEFLEQYSTGKDSVMPIAKAWFGYKSLRIKSRFKTMEVHVLDFFPVFTGAINILFVLSIISFFILEGYKQKKVLTKLVIIAGSYWMMNLAFSVFASPIALRFQLLNIIIVLSCTSVIIEYIVKSMRTMNISVSEINAEENIILIH